MSWIAAPEGAAIAFTFMLVLMLAGFPVFIAFMMMNVAAVLLLFGPRGFSMLTNSVYDTLTSSTLAPIPLFILMGEVLFRSGTAGVVFQSMDTLISRMRGRDFVLSTALSTVFGALSGAAVGVAAMMGRTLLPQMRERQCNIRLSVGSIIAGACLAPIIPPSVLIVIIGMTAEVSIARLLVGGILPGLLLALMILGYCMIRVSMNPELAPAQPATDQHVSGRERMLALLRILPFGLIVFCVVGFILIGIATPSEAAATGVLAALFSAALFGRLDWNMVAQSLVSAGFISAMILIIMASSKLFSQLLAFTGATAALANFVVASDLATWQMVLLMMLIPFLLCMFMDQIAMMLIFIPIYKPLLEVLGLDPVWFWILFLINVTLGGFTPPFGYVVFALKGAVPELRLSEIFAATWPFVGVFVLAMLVIAALPQIITFLPGLM